MPPACCNSLVPVKRCKGGIAPQIPALIAAITLFATAFYDVGADAAPGNGGDIAPRYFLTNLVQFRELSPVNYSQGCAFHFEGAVTLIDTNRHLLVLQDPTAAVALNFNLDNCQVQVGQHVSIDGTNCQPYVPAFPHYPYRPSGWDVDETFEAPSDWGDYHLTRMRGFLHPSVTGDYTFWIASDNSSELWLSASQYPADAKRIAFIPRFS